MRKLPVILLMLALAMPVGAQKKATTTQKKTATTQKKAATTQKKSASTKKTTTKKATKSSKNTKKKTTKSKTTDYGNAEIKGLQSQRSQIQKKIRQQEQALQANRADVKKRLQNLMVLNSEIANRQKNIETIEQDISHIDGNLGLLEAQLSTLEQQLDDCKARYVKSMRYITRHHSIQDQLMFIFSAKSFSQMVRRFRFVKEYAAYQKAQGETLKAKQAQVAEKRQQLHNARGQKNTLLSKGKQERSELEGQQAEQKTMVSNLQRQQKTIQKVIDDQKKKDAALNAEIDRLVAIEVEKARQRAAAEAKRKAEAAAAAKKKAEELKRKREEAAARERENQRRLAEAREREEKLKAEAAAAKKAEDAAKQVAAEQAAREAEAERKAIERKKEADEARSKKELAAAKKEADEASWTTAADRKLSGGFEANRGRLPMPITGGYRIVSHFGQYNVEGLPGVKLDNKGINILGKPGCQARAIYDGEVSAVVSVGGTMVVMVRHGSYISVYCNLKSVNVSRGQKVSTRQALGAVGTDNILQFQLRRETAKLNPEAWLGR